MSAPALIRTALCAGLATIGAVAAQADTATWVARLGSADHRERSDAYRELQRTRPVEAIDLLARQLATFPLNGQSLGISLLQNYPADRTRDAFRHLLDDGGPFLRAASAAALYRTGDRSTAAAIATAIADATGAERAMVLSRLYGIDDARVRDAVRAWIASGSSATDVENALFHLLTSSRQRDEVTVHAATRLLGRPDTQARKRAACAAYLVAVGDGQHAPALAAAIDEDRTALSRLMRFLERAPTLGAELTGTLAELLAEARNKTEVTLAARVLGKHAPKAAAIELRGLLNAEDAQIREAALKAIAELPGGLDEKTLRSMLAADEPEVVLVAADTLRRMDDHSGLPRVLELVRAGGQGRLRAVQVLGGFRVRAAVPPLLDALEDDGEPVRHAAFQALGRLWIGLFPYRRIDVSTTGYRPDASPAERAAGVAALRAFWNRSR